MPNNLFSVLEIKVLNINDVFSDGPYGDPVYEGQTVSSKVTFLNNVTTYVKVDFYKTCKNPTRQTLQSIQQMFAKKELKSIGVKSIQFITEDK